MSRVVFCTWGGGYNFGGCFQSYALHRKLQDLGFEVCFLEGIRIDRSLKGWTKRLLRQFGFLQIAEWFRQSGNLVDRKVREWGRLYNQVIVRTEGQLQRLLSGTDCFISGSDQIWNTYHHFTPFFFLDFAEGKKRISYASSIGTVGVNPDCSERVKHLLLGYSHISVREQKGVDALSRLTGRDDIVQVVDPSFLLTSEEWHEIGANGKLEFEIPARYILCYVLGRNPNYLKWLDEIKTRIGINDVIVLPARYDNPDFAPQGCSIYRDAGPREFIKLLEGAAMVVTDSFHATAFCLNFTKPFVEFMRFSDDDPRSQNSRIYDMLDKFSMRNRVYEGGDSKILTGFSKVEKEQVHAWYEGERRRCVEWLRNAIES